MLLREKERAGLAHIMEGKVYRGPQGEDGELMRLYDQGRTIIQQMNDYEGEQRAPRRVRAGPSEASMQGLNPGVCLVRLEEMGRFSEEEEEEDVRW